jgi:ribonuclease G
MANPRNRATVEEALKTELERDRTKTYVVEISPLGLVEMTRQNVTDGPREILTRKCAICGGDGVVLSEASAAVDAERHLRALAASAPRTKAFKLELNAGVASVLIGPGASRLQAIEEETRRRFLIESREDVPTNHFEELSKGTYESLAPKAPVQEGAEISLKLVEIGLHDVKAAIGKLDGLAVCVGDGAPLVGKRAKVRVERVMDGVAYATLVGKAAPAEAPITAEREAEKPTRKPPARKGQPKTDESEPALEPEPEPELELEAEPELEPEPELEAEPEPAAEAETATADEAEGEPKPKKKTRRGSRGGRRRRKKPATEDGSADGAGPKIHLPAPELGRAEPEAKADAEPKAEPSPPEVEAAAENGTEPVKPKKKTRRGSRGGRRRRKGPAKTSPAAE